MSILVSLLLCIFFMNSGLGLKEDANMSSCIEKERQALLDVKANLTDYYGFLDDWGSNAENMDCCKWVGVTCHNYTGHVIELDLGGSNLKGNISWSLQVLNELRYLNLNFVKLQSCSLSIFSGLSQLQRLHVSGASPSGCTIPHQLANLSKLIELDLSGNSLSGSIPFSFGNMTSLTYLDLSRNQLRGVIPKSFGNFSSFVHLDLSQNLLNGPLPSFSGCSSLIHMSLAYNSLNGSMPDFTGCTSLKKLDLSNNMLSGNMPNSLGQLLNLEYINVSKNSVKGCMPDFTISTSLQILDLSYNFLSGNMPNTVGQLSNLEYLDVSHNSLNGSIPNFIECTSLKILDLSNNFLCGDMPNGVGQLSNLTYLDVSNNSLNGSIPKFIEWASLWYLDLSSNNLSGNVPDSLGEASNLKYLDLSSNSLGGVISDVHFLHLNELRYLDLSFNSLSFSLSFNGTFPNYQLETIKLQSCKLGPKFPMWIKEDVNLFIHLDFSNASISDNIPTWFWSQSSELRFLNLSSNEINGTLPDMMGNFSSNHLEGKVPASLLSSMTTLNLSGNRFSGTLAFLCDFADFLTSLDLSNNSFSGSLPDCRLKFQEKLVILNLSNNNLSGKIPYSLGFLFNLESLYLRTNAFVGEVPISLSNCTRLRFVDFSQNKLSGVIPDWIGEKLSELYVLVLGSNEFHGRLPSQVCRLYNLQVLDLSNNGLLGDIPTCFGNFTAMTRRSFGDDMKNHSYYNCYDNFSFSTWLPCKENLHGEVCPYHSQEVQILDNTWVRWKGTQRSFGSSGLQLLKSIDLSRNNLSGKVPYEITNLSDLVSLNLSSNKLYGEVPKDMGGLKSLESLDLSNNEFFGRIPWSLALLNFLSYLDLSNNNLSGEIPVGSQLQRFDYTSYSGNPQLCGPPLTPRCGFVPPPGKKDVEEVEEDSWKSYYTGMGVGFVVGFLGICGALILDHRCRHFVFGLLSHMKDWIYVTVVVYFGKFVRKFRR